MSTTDSPARLRVAAVSYLNTVPLVWGFLHGPQRGIFDLDFCVPSECADRILAGTADIGILPSIEIPRLGLEAVRGAGIACRGAVRSILLISKVPPARIRTLAADASSRTSVMLARIVLARRYDTEPELITMPPDLASMLEAADAALIIGDPALRTDPASLPHAVLDLGAEWAALTGLPMVFAVWAGPARAITAAVAEAFRGSCRYGLAHLEEIASHAGPERGVPAELARQYLTRHIVFELGAREYQGLDLFLQYAAELDQAAQLGQVTA
ncbi:MAG: menaquinone biosynthesis protein [Acidobacteria bacterium]|nr:menaquinone biosynthesis protein [Acidobacteriota bacterium]